MITATIKQCRLVTIKYIPIHKDCKCNVQESAKRLRDTSQVAGTFKIKNLNQDPDTRCWILKCARPRLRTIVSSRRISLLETSELNIVAGLCCAHHRTTGLSSTKLCRAAAKQSMRFCARPVGFTQRAEPTARRPGWASAARACGHQPTKARGMARTRRA